MKKLLVVVAMLLVTGMSYAGEACSSSLLSKVYVEPEGLAIVPFNEDYDAVGVYAGGKVGYQINEWIAIEAESAWSRWENTEYNQYVYLIPLLFNARVNILPGKWFVDPYIYGGLGAGFFDTDEENVTIDNALIGQVGLGASYHVNANLSINLDMKFFFAETSASGPTWTSDEDLNSFMVGGSATWRF